MPQVSRKTVRKKVSFRRSPGDRNAGS